jgi:hypothetical protein
MSPSKGPLPTAFNYNDYVTLIRSQGPGGCYLYALLTVTDILKKIEMKGWAPNLSYAFAEYIYNSEYLYNKQTNKWDIKNNYQFNQDAILMNIGCCTETSMPTNFDSGPKIPTLQQIEDAQLFKLKKVSEWIKPDSDHQDLRFQKKIKRLIFEKSPLIADVWLAQHDKDSASHVVAITGYDDNTQEFQFVNSCGDRYGDNGFGSIPYTNFLESGYPQTGPFPQIIEVRYVENEPSKNLYPSPYFPNVPTARIKITTSSNRNNYGRNVLVVKLGVDCEKALVIWDRNNSYLGAGIGLVDSLECDTLNCKKIFDTSRNLFIDIQLPYYWFKYWPPLGSNEPPGQNIWYLQIENHSINGTSFYFPSVNATLEQFSIKMLYEENADEYYCLDLPKEIGPEESMMFIVSTKRSS